MKKNTFLIMFMTPLFAVCQDSTKEAINKLDSITGNTGIRFESSLSWAAIKAEAKIENKSILIDCYASWCTPCKMMDERIYPQKEVGDYFNVHFISLKVQMDRTSKDDQRVRTLYPVADSIAAQFAVRSYPTFLFFSPDGVALHKFVGAAETGQEFIQRSADAFDHNRQYFTLFSQLPFHLGDSAFLLNAIPAAKNARDQKNARSLANDYIGLLKEPIIKPVVELVAPYIQSESDNGFDFFIQNAARINLVMEEKHFVEGALTPIIFKEEIAPIIPMKSAVIPWNDIVSTIEAKYPSLDKDFFSKQLGACFNADLMKEMAKEIANKEIQVSDWNKLSREWKVRFPDHDIGQIMLKAKIGYYASKKLWEESGKVAISLIEQYGAVLSPRSVNDLIWDVVFEHVSDPTTLRQAIKHMGNVVRLAPNDPNDLDTYANLIYKAGHKQEAMDWENKAIDVAKSNNIYVGDFKVALKKMEGGRITWETPGLN